jgi:hypothetical protein
MRVIHPSITKLSNRQITISSVNKPLQFFFISLLLVLFWIPCSKAQVTIGAHTGFSGYSGIHAEFSLEVPFAKRFALNSRMSYVLPKGFMLRSGIRYIYPVFKNTDLRLGIDVGVYRERNEFNTSFTVPFFITGGNFGIHQKFGERWGILAEINLINMTSHNTKIQALLPQLGVTYRF